MAWLDKKPTAWEDPGSEPPVGQRVWNVDDSPPPAWVNWLFDAARRAIDQLEEFLEGAAGSKATLKARLDTELDADGKVKTGAAANQIPRRDAEGKIPGSITGNAAYAAFAGTADTAGSATTAGDAAKVGGYSSSLSVAANTIPVRNAEGKTPGDITGDATSVQGKPASAFAATIHDHDASYAAKVHNHASQTLSPAKLILPVGTNAGL
jgi:hypothetical protein